MTSPAHMEAGGVHPGAAPQPRLRVRVRDAAVPHSASKYEGELTRLPRGGPSDSPARGYPLRLTR